MAKINWNATEAQSQKEQAVKVPEDHGTLMAELAELKQRVSTLEALLADK